MSDNACFNTKTGVTYIAGCTDSSYRDDACPSKPCGNDNVWASLVYCNGTSNKWSCCGGEGNFPTFVDICYCQDNSPAAFHAASTLNQMASLPYTASVVPLSSVSSSDSGVVRIAAATTRTSSSASGTTSSAASTAPTTSSNPPSTSSSPSSSQASTDGSKSQAAASETSAATSDGRSAASGTTAGAPSSASSSGVSAAPLTASQSSSASTVPAVGMSTGVKIGVGVGIAGGVLFIAVLVMLALVWRKRRQGRQTNAYAHTAPDYGIEDKDWIGNDGVAVPGSGAKAKFPAPERSPASPRTTKTGLRSPDPRTPVPEYQEFGSPRPSNNAVYEMPGHHR
ncbi:MAG: hypothetical protein M1835_004695 [Candelina submexicana]|nr:MAG: hypothetical protein M1835_004695 [Candelina submexicana]